MRATEKVAQLGQEPPSELPEPPEPSSPPSLPSCPPQTSPQSFQSRTSLQSRRSRRCPGHRCYPSRSCPSCSSRSRSLPSLRRRTSPSCCRSIDHSFRPKPPRTPSRRIRRSRSIDRGPAIRAAGAPRRGSAGHEPSVGGTARALAGAARIPAARLWLGATARGRTVAARTAVARGCERSVVGSTASARVPRVHPRARRDPCRRERPCRSGRSALRYAGRSFSRATARQASDAPARRPERESWDPSFPDAPQRSTVQRVARRVRVRGATTSA